MRHVGDDRSAVVKVIALDGVPHLCLLALKDMEVGTEVTIDSGGLLMSKDKKVSILKSASTINKVGQQACYADRWRLERRYGILELQPVFIDSSFIDSTINLQVMNLNTSQMEWVADHLGHSLDVEKTYYQLASSMIQKAKIAKLLILAGLGKIKGKTLNDFFLAASLVSSEKYFNGGPRFKFAFARNTGLIALISTGDTSTES